MLKLLCAVLTAAVIGLFISLLMHKGEIKALEDRIDILLPIACQYPEKLEPLILAKVVEVQNKMKLDSSVAKIRAKFDMKCP